MKYFPPKLQLLVVEQTHFWIVEITRVEHPTCLLMNQIPLKLVFIFVFLSLFVQVKLVSGRRSLVGDVRGQAVAPEHHNLQDWTLWRTPRRGKTLKARWQSCGRGLTSKRSWVLIPRRPPPPWEKALKTKNQMTQAKNPVKDHPTR